MAAVRDMIEYISGVGNANLVPPWGGTEALLSTNPVAIDSACFAAPVDRTGYGHDEHGVWKNQAQSATQRADARSWMIDRQGQPLTILSAQAKDSWFPSAPERLWARADVRPAGWNLNGAAFGRDVVDYTVDSKTRAIRDNDHGGGYCRVYGCPGFQTGCRRGMDLMKSIPTLPGVDEIGFPASTLKCSIASECLKASRSEQIAQGAG